MSLSNTTQRLKLQVRLSQYTALRNYTRLFLAREQKKPDLLSSCHSGERRLSHSDPFLVYFSIHNFIRSSLPHSIEPRGISPDHQGIFMGTIGLAKWLPEGLVQILSVVFFPIGGTFSV